MSSSQEMLSQSCIYAIRATILISSKDSKDNNNYIPVKELSDELNISFHFLTKTLQHLTHANILESYTGPKGGVKLAKPANKIFLIDIIEAIDGEDIFNTCILGLVDCCDSKPCPLHKKWKQSKSQTQKIFEKTNLATLAKDTKNFKLRL